jgi:hypothetical protein
VAARRDGEEFSETLDGAPERGFEHARRLLVKPRSTADVARLPREYRDPVR